MHYITSDVHNDNEKLNKLLKKLDLQKDDKLYILGDLFDRSNHNPDPVGVYFSVLKLGERCQVIKENHEQELAEYIVNYFNTKERKRGKLIPYTYNSFDLLVQRLTSVDLQNMARWIFQLPIQVSVKIEDTDYLMAHAMTATPENAHEEGYYLCGEDVNKFLENGIEGFISICGHSNPEGNTVWKNKKDSVWICDCGCGFASGRLGCICLETGDIIYV